MNEEAIRLIKTFLDEFVPEPSNSDPTEVFKQRSYTRIIAEQLIYILSDCPFDAPDDLVFQYSLEQERCYLCADSDKAKEVFSLVCEACNTFLDLIRKEKYE